jgi:hypothetical protein
VRILASHVREVAKLLVLDYQDREDVQDFISTLSNEAREARDEVERLLEETHLLRPEDKLWLDMKRVRDDTFHYARDRASQDRLTRALDAVQDMEGVYVLGENGQMLRADYADLVVANRMHPFEEDESLPVTDEMHRAIVRVHGHVATFITEAEQRYLLGRLPEGTVQYEE